MRPAVGSPRLLLLFILVTACATPLSTDQPPARHVILISIDGLRPEFYLDSGYPAPILRKLGASGARAQTVEPVFPSNTNPSHATILTGLRPNRHGIIFNVRFEPDGTRGHLVRAEREQRAGEVAGRVGHQRAREVGLGLMQDHRRVGDGRAVRVRDHAADDAGGGLRLGAERRGRAEQHERRARQDA